MRRIKNRFVALAGVFLIGAAIYASAQGTMARPTAPPDSCPPPGGMAGVLNGKVRTDNTPSATELVARGQVAMADGSAPEELVEIYSACGGTQTVIAVADSKGRFSFDASVLSDLSGAKECVLLASLEGYRSETKPLADVNPKSSTKLRKIVLEPVSSDTSGLISPAGAQASKNAKKAYQKALDEAAKQEWQNAMESLQKATAAYAGYSSAWLSLGILQQSGGDRDGARKSFEQAAQADGKFALPWIRLAALDAARGDWQAAGDHSQKAIDLNPTAFPHAFELNAMANVKLQKLDAAEKSATEGLKLDHEHRYPELKHALGIVLKVKHDREGAMKRLQAYVDEAPNEPNAATAKSDVGPREK